MLPFLPDCLPSASRVDREEASVCIWFRCGVPPKDPRANKKNLIYIQYLVSGPVFLTSLHQAPLKSFYPSTFFIFYIFLLNIYFFRSLWLTLTAISFSNSKTLYLRDLAVAEWLHPNYQRSLNLLSKDSGNEWKGRTIKKKNRKKQPRMLVRSFWEENELTLVNITSNQENKLKNLNFCQQKIQLLSEGGEVCVCVGRDEKSTPPHF